MRQDVLSSDWTYMEQMSDSDVTMLASETFDEIIPKIQNSCLNFSVQLTPFSAMISVKKSFVRDKVGTVILPDMKPLGSCKEENLDVKNSQLEKNLQDLEKTHLNTLVEGSKAY